MRSVVAIRHVPFEDLGTLEPLLRERGYAVHYYDIGVHELWTLEARRPDLLVVLGGPIGAYDEAAHPFLVDEIEIIRSRLAASLPILGICLGAQLMARATGASVGPMQQKEIGFGAIGLTDAGRASCLAPLQSEAAVLHWHGDQFEVPAPATLLASTARCPNQAFSIGAHALALQFHLEADARRIDQWLVGHAVELALAGVDPRDLRRQADEHGARLTEASQRIFGQWLDSVEQRRRGE